MDQLIYLAIFVLFSAVSAILDRRRRRQSLEEARRRAEVAAKQPPAAARTEVEEDEEEEQGKWPWPEIFESPPSRPSHPMERKRAPAEVLSTEASPAEAPGEGKYRRAEEELREMEQRVREMNQRTREADRQSQEEFRLVELQAAARMGSGAGSRSGAGASPGEGRPRRQGWGLTPREARRALVYAEILGPPKSERRD